MKKTWDAPQMESLMIKNTALKKYSGTKVDGSVYTTVKNADGDVVFENKAFDLYS